MVLFCNHNSNLSHGLDYYSPLAYVALLGVLQRLVDAGNTVIVIEHHLDVIKNADYIIDLGPGAGDRGGYVVATGTPEEIAREKSSATGQYLTKVLHRDIEYAVTN